MISVYSATLLAGFYKPPIAALLNVPSGAISIASAVGTGYAVRRLSNRWIWIVLCAIPGIIGGSLMSFLPHSSPAGTLVGVYLINTVTAALPIVYQWTAANVAGHTKRPLSVAVISASLGLGSLIGPQTFQAKDAPQYLPAKITVPVTLASGAIAAVLLRCYYAYENRRRDRRMGTHVGGDFITDRERWGNITDKENASFRYVY